MALGGWSRPFQDNMVEQLCFVCKDGGDVRVCDFRNCFKCYHPRCVGKDDDYLSSDDQFICDWHKCVNCKRNSDYRCLCCPSSSACGDCLGKIEFVQVKQAKGFCSNCLKMVMMIETNIDAYLAGAMVDFIATEEYIICFRDYWALLKHEERLTLLDLQEAHILLIRSLNCKKVRDSEKFPDGYHKTDVSLLGGNDDVEQTFLLETRDRQNESQTSFKRKKSNTKTYVGWGSKELTEFLSSIGKDTTKPLDHFRVTGIVREYIQQKNLLQNKKKKSVTCDDNLRSLFNKKKLKYNMIHSLLDIHLAANADSEDESLDGAEDGCGLIMKKKPRSTLEPNIPKRVSEINKRCFASLNQNNLKLIYLRRTLVMKLLSHRDTFEHKVVGCLVRVKNDLKSYNYQMSKKRYQLGLVTGIKKSSEEYKIKDTCTDILLCVPNIWDDVRISMLSEEDFEEDECNDLLLLAEKELFKRPTVAELEEKEAIVHADIVNHWIDMKLLRLEKEIEIAQEKGWRQEFHDLRCQQKLLSTPAERQRRLEEVPEIIPDTEERKETEDGAAESNLFHQIRDSKRNIATCLKDVEDKSKGATKQRTDSLEVVIEELREGTTKQVADSWEVVNVIEESPEGAIEQTAEPLEVVMEESPEGAIEQAAEPLEVVMEESPEGASEQGDTTCEVASECTLQRYSYSVAPLEVLADGKAICNGVTPGPGLHNQMYTAQVNADGGTAQPIDLDNGKDENGSRHHNGGDKVVIYLDSDEDEDLHPGQHQPERAVHGAPEGANGGTVHIHRAPEAVNGRMLIPRASEAVNGIAAPTFCDLKLISEAEVPALETIEEEEPTVEIIEDEEPALEIRASEAVNGIAAPTFCDLKLMIEAEEPALEIIEEEEPTVEIIEDEEPALEIMCGRSDLIPMWYYMDPQKQKQGPFSMAKMREWQRGGYFKENFTVWRIGQSYKKPILLKEAMRMTY